MNINSSIIFVIEVIGTVAFASSGAMVAIKKKLDLFGIIVLGGTTAVGGGMIRDLILGNNPPNMFRNPIYVLMSFITVMILFSIVRVNQRFLESSYLEAYEKIMNIFDAIGLGAFTVLGINTAVVAGFDNYKFLLIFLGVITGVGGGILRDIMAGTTPFVLRKHIYASASIMGAIVCVYGDIYIDSTVSMILGASTVILIRFLATHFRWNLPTAIK